jgi:hypothetical protein
MKLLVEEDKKYKKKIPKREQKGVKEVHHRTMMRLHRATMDMFGNYKISAEKIKQTAFIVVR